ncbi:MFS transporter [Klebsiella pneumoniae]|uniref:MFS transporter n=2 Tax=Klebsiella pneumoniae TaxID=573 RepID=UPI001BAA7D19|nr:MFS transporter [Klebsiella pneumoniae]MBQ5217846.1 MFS transporter [Klebsiella pneumoniae]HEE1306836.1 MFS transporter [Klebsiella pneumoniae]
MSSLSQAATAAEKRTNARYWIVVMLFIVTSFNYGDRATLSIAGSEMARDIGLDPVGMGYVFSAFSWAYVIGQIPGGWLLDRFGSKRVYFWSIFIWSMFTLLQGFVDIFSGFGIIVALFTLRFLVGLAESPSFPGNSRIVAAWFPVYLVQARGMSILKAGFVASIPAVCGFVGGVLGGVISDWLMRRTGSLNIARKTPIVLGMLLSMTMLMCNYVNVEWMVIGFMAMAFFGKGIGALGWAVMADTAPKEISGLSGGLFNMFGNISGIVTPIAIGYIVGTTGSFNGALIYVGIHALVAVLSYLVLVGDIKRIELKPVAGR